MRKLLLKIHMVLAIVAGAFIVIMGLSGSVLVFRADLERAFLPAVTAPVASAVSASLPLGQVVRQFQDSHPGATIRSITLPAPGSNDALLLVVNEGKIGPT